ncbi:hypothetical protein RUM44_004321 [Polyplax serrata]|uniref:Protein takeout n=1 Tax=Polyplax serrata TaxID=468196 RepID=A0ABR1B2I1_POLSC
MLGYLVFACALCVSASAGHSKLPSEWPRCKRYDPNVDECLVKAIQSIVPQIVHGVSKLGLFPLDPLKITKLELAQGSGPVSIDLKFRDLILKGLGNVTITNIVSDLDNFKLKIQGYFKQPIQVEADHTTHGQVLILPLGGSGKCQLALDNVKAEMSLVGHEEKKDGKTFMHLDKLDVELETRKLHMTFENLISDNKDLGDGINLFLNENWQEIFKELYPVIQEALGSAFKAIASRIFSKVPYDDIFLP